MNPYAAPQTDSANDPPSRSPIYAWFVFTAVATLCSWWPVLSATEFTRGTTTLSFLGLFVLLSGSWMCAIFTEAHDAALKAWRERNPERTSE
jgi:hypothetical protein